MALKKPGTSTNISSECIASSTKSPLMILTTSDIGTKPIEVEKNLTDHFKIAKKWNAVLLIDEADVFMERRSTSDLERNSLVAGEHRQFPPKKRNQSKLPQASYEPSSTTTAFSF
jgi:SpoVK/Ycf46/Vps4 family AAA+-type ATPase